jgi:hypothetical protein
MVKTRTRIAVVVLGLVAVPSHELVLVQLGFTPDPEAWGLGSFIGDVLEAIPENGT